MNTKINEREVDYAKNLEKAILRARLSRVEGSMFEFAKLVLELKEKRLYKSLGFKNFNDWYLDWGLPVPTVNTWLNLYRTYIDRYGFKVDDLRQVEVRILKDLLPVARSHKVTKEMLLREIDQASRMDYKDFIEILPKIKMSFGLKK